MKTETIPGNTQPSVVPQSRNLLYESSVSKLQDMAWRALNIIGKKNNEVVVVCIQVDSSLWRDVVKEVLPNYRIQGIGDSKEHLITYGITNWSFCRIMARHLPEIADDCMEVPPASKVKTIVLSDDGYVIQELLPTRNDRLMH